MAVISDAPQVARQVSWRADRTALGRLCALVLALLLACVSLLSLTSGASDTSAINALSSWVTGAEISARDQIVLWQIRLPRLLMGILVGGALAVTGALMQSLFRNPLADPGLVGVSAGAGLGVIVVIVLSAALPPVLSEIFGYYLLPAAAFFGGWASTLILYRVATRKGTTSVATLLLAGIALGALAGAVSGVLVYYADDAQLRELTFWSMGSLSGANWSKVLTAAPIILLALAATPFLARGMNALALGEAAAAHMGVNVQKVKWRTILCVAAATGAAVAMTGGIGFVGIVVPHILRLSIGPDNRTLLPNAALLGAILLIVADMIARSVIAPAELPIGIVTAIMGAPVFLWILLRRRSMLEI